MTVQAPLSAFALIELPDVLKGIKIATRIRNGEPASTPEDWFEQRVNGNE